MIDGDGFCSAACTSAESDGILAGAAERSVIAVEGAATVIKQESEAVEGVAAKLPIYQCTIKGH